MTIPNPKRIPGQRPFTIAICGGGIAGLALAIGLLRRNVPIHIYESSHAFAEVGAGVAFGPNGLRAMSLIDPEIRERFDQRATTNASEDKKTVLFDFYAGMDCGIGKAGEKVATVESGEVCYSSIHRARFLDALVALVPSEDVSFGKRVVEVEELADGVRLHFADGETAEASAAVGCDGVKSNLRHLVLEAEDEAAHPSFTGKYAYRGLIPMDQAAGLLGDEMARNGSMWLGDHGHVLSFPIEKGALMNVVAFRTQESSPDNGGSTSWPHGDRWVLPTTRSKMQSDFSDWGPTVRDLLTLMPQDPDIWALFDYPPARTYFRNRTCLCGDAAHASTPHQGAGAGMALEDAYVLSNLLGAVAAKARHYSSSSSPSSSSPSSYSSSSSSLYLLTVQDAFRAFDAVRRPRTQRLVKTSWEAGKLYELEKEGVWDDGDRMREDLKTRFDWIWEEDLERELQDAMALLGASDDEGRSNRALE